MSEILHMVLFNNPVLDYIISISIILISLICVKFIRYLTMRFLRSGVGKSGGGVNEYLIMGLSRFVFPFLYFLCVYAGIFFLRLSPGTEKALNSGIIIVFTYFAIRIVALVLNYSVRYYWDKRDGSEKSGSRLKGIQSFINLVAWTIGVIFLLDNLGFKISAVIAGLGIGGIAVALAAQALLGDLFSYFVIFFDKPFETGDSITVDDKSGVVEYIGIKTTKLSGQGGEQIIFSNSDLTKSRIHNLKRMQKRHVVFNISVSYMTSPDKLKIIPGIIKEIIGETEGAGFDRVHFRSYQNNGLNYEIAYYVNTPEFNKYMDIQQQINLLIFERFLENNISFAYLTQTT